MTESRFDVWIAEYRPRGSRLQAGCRTTQAWGVARDGGRRDRRRRAAAVRH